MTLRQLGGAMALAAGVACAPLARPAGDSTYEAFAIRYATLPNFRV
jgi:hypothetical protein